MLSSTVETILSLFADRVSKEVMIQYVLRT